MLCLDVGITMSSSAPGEESSLEQAKKVVTKFLQRQVFVTLNVVKSCLKGKQYHLCAVEYFFVY